MIMTDNFREKIYKNSPVVFQNILVSIQGSIFRRQRFDQEFYTELHSSQLRAKLPHKDVQIYQFETLKKFLIFAYENSPYFREKHT